MSDDPKILALMIQCPFCDHRVVETMKVSGEPKDGPNAWLYSHHISMRYDMHSMWMDFDCPRCRVATCINKAD
jgi:ribosomal protein S27E